MSYTYEKFWDDTLNDLVDCCSLKLEIDDAGLGVALEAPYINATNTGVPATSPVNMIFVSEPSAGDKTTIDGVLAAHTGEPCDPTGVVIQGENVGINGASEGDVLTVPSEGEVAEWKTPAAPGILGEILCYTRDTKHFGWSPVGGADAQISTAAAAYVDAGHALVEGIAFPDTGDTGIVIPAVIVPASSTLVTWIIYGRAASAPGGAKGVKFEVYERVAGMQGGQPVGSWGLQSPGLELAILTEAGAYYRAIVGPVALSQLGLLAGRIHQLNIFRQPGDAADDLSGDCQLNGMRLIFT